MRITRQTRGSGCVGRARSGLVLLTMVGLVFLPRAAMGEHPADSLLQTGMSWVYDVVPGDQPASASAGWMQLGDPDSAVALEPADSRGQYPRQIIVKVTGSGPACGVQVTDEEGRATPLVPRLGHGAEESPRLLAVHSHGVPVVFVLRGRQSALLAAMPAELPEERQLLSQAPPATRASGDALYQVYMSPAKESVTVPAGTFADCWVTETVVTSQGQEQSLERSWFAPRVGLVRWQLLGPDQHPVLELRLRQYSQESVASVNPSADFLRAGMTWVYDVLRGEGSAAAPIGWLELGGETSGVYLETENPQQQYPPRIVVQVMGPGLDGGYVLSVTDGEGQTGVAPRFGHGGGQVAQLLATHVRNVPVLYLKARDTFEQRKTRLAVLAAMPSTPLRERTLVLEGTRDLGPAGAVRYQVYALPKEGLVEVPAGTFPDCWVTEAVVDAQISDQGLAGMLAPYIGGQGRSTERTWLAPGTGLVKWQLLGAKQDVVVELRLREQGLRAVPGAGH